MTLRNPRAALAAAAAVLTHLSAWTQASAGADAASAASSAAAAAPTSTPAAEAAASAPSVATGRRIYTSYCARCHGLNLAVSSSAFFDLRTFPKDDKERFMRSLRQGLRAMPAWAGIVKPEEMESIWLFVGSVNLWAAKSP